MAALLVQLMLVGIWGWIVAAHGCRLYRLAAVPLTAQRALFVRRKAQRMWWWLGRDEFWEGLRRDAARCVELTLMLALLAATL